MNNYGFNTRTCNHNRRANSRPNPYNKKTRNGYDKKTRNINRKDD